MVVIGAGGHGREVLDLVEALNAPTRTYEPLGFVVDPEYAAPGTPVRELPILGGFEWLSHMAGEVQVACGVGDPRHRLQLVQRAEELGASFCTLVHPKAHVTESVKLGVGVVIAAGCVLTSDIRIGNHVHINIGSTISHDCVLEDFVYLAPGVHVTGQVHIESGCYVGAAATIIQKSKIGAWSIIGAGSVVLSDIPPNSTVVGVPGRVIKSRPKGWHLAGVRLANTSTDVST